MTETERLAQLKQMLTSNLIRERRAGIKMAVEMLANDLHSDEVRVLLENLAKNDLITTVQDDARQSLAADEAQRNPPPAAPLDYVFGAKCTYCHHVNYLDKREVCPKQSNLSREVIVRDGQEMDFIWVTCKYCGKDFKTPVPCKGYK